MGLTTVCGPGAEQEARASNRQVSQSLNRNQTGTAAGGRPGPLLVHEVFFGSKKDSEINRANNKESGENSELMHGVVPIHKCGMNSLGRIGLAQALPATVIMYRSRLPAW